jgi:hypothetical protein
MGDEAIRHFEQRLLAPMITQLCDPSGTRNRIWYFVVDSPISRRERAECSVARAITMPEQRTRPKARRLSHRSPCAASGFRWVGGWRRLRPFL